MDTLNTVVAFVAEYWGTLLLIAAFGIIPRLLLMWGMVHNPQITMLFWAGLMVLFAIWGQSLTQELTHLRENWLWWMIAISMTVSGIGMVTTSIISRQRIFLAFGISAIAFANAGFVAPLSLTWLTLNWWAMGFGTAFYVALFVLDRRHAESDHTNHRQLESPSEEPMNFTRMSLPR